MPNFSLSLFFIFVSRSACHLRPDQSLSTDDREEKGEYLIAFKDGHNKYAMLYLPVGKKIAVNTSSINEERKTSRFNPKNGEKSGLKVLIENGNELYFATHRIEKRLGVEY